MASYSFTTTESTSQTQDATFTISDMSSASSVSVGTGSASITSQSGTSVTIHCINGTSTRYTDATVLVPENKTGSATVSQVYTWSNPEGTGGQWYPDTVQTSAPSTIKASDGVHDLSLGNIVIDTNPTPPPGNGTLGQKITRYGTGHGNYSGYTNSTSRTYYYQYSGTITYTPITTTGGQIDLVSAGESTINVRIINLEFGSGYSTLNILGPGGVTTGVSVLGSNGVSYYSSNATFSSLTPSTSYSFTAHFTHSGQLAGSSSSNYSTTAHVDVAPTLNFSSITQSGGIYCTFSGYDPEGLRSTNTYSLQISGPDNTSYGTAVNVSNNAQNTNLTYTFTKDGLGNNFIGGKTYTVLITLYDTANQTAQTAKSLVYTNTVPTLNFSNLDGLNSCIATFSGYDPEGLRSTNTYALQISGPDDTSYGTAVNVSNDTQNTNLTYTFTKDSVGNNFIVGKTYTVRITLYDTLNATAIATKAVKYTKTRPANFAWTTAKSSGVVFNLTASEWNALIDRINDFQDYKGVARTTPTRASSGGIFYASMFNEVINAINSLTPPTAAPATVVSKGTIYATDLNKLRDSINSIV